MQQSLIRINGTELWVQQVGEGDPLVFLHGFALDHRLWDAQTAYFQSGWRVIRYDLRGFGHSSRLTDQPYRHADDLIALLDHLEIDSAHVVGLSLGGRVALDAALLYPARVQSITLVSTILEGYTWSQETLNWRRQSWNASMTGDIAAAKRMWLDGALFAPALANPRSYDALQQMNDDYHGDHFVSPNPEDFLEPSSFQRLTDVTTPTQIIIGERDMTDVREIGWLMHEQIRGALIEVIDGVGHLPNLENPGVFNHVLARFLEKSANP